LRIFLKFADTLSELCGKTFAWAIIFLVGGLVYEVVARHLFAAPTIWAWDVSYMLYGVHFMMGVAFVLYTKGHVRMDLIYKRFPPRWQAVSDLCLYLLLFFPVVAVLLVKGIDFAWLSWTLRERAIWSAWRVPIYPFKTVLPVATFLLMLQGIAEFIRCLNIAMKRG